VSLDAAWQRALELAWASFLAGTTPVGAVVTGPDGNMVAEGRGRRYEQPDGTGRQLAYCHIAHAEINALAELPPPTVVHRGCRSRPRKPGGGRSSLLARFRVHAAGSLSSFTSGG
jgi:Cytidine and deoxycytidylate deaminase zinc-binding region